MGCGGRADKAVAVGIVCDSETHGGLCEEGRIIRERGGGWNERDESQRRRRGGNVGATGKD